VETWKWSGWPADGSRRLELVALSVFLAMVESQKDLFGLGM
jgi:hypothetical protein